jgi:hypothetical protein
MGKIAIYRFRDTFASDFMGYLVARAFVFPVSVMTSLKKRTA